MGPERFIGRQSEPEIARIASRMESVLPRIRTLDERWGDRIKLGGMWMQVMSLLLTW